jgi:hypothetical protein
MSSPVKRKAGAPSAPASTQKQTAKHARAAGVSCERTWCTLRKVYCSLCGDGAYRPEKMHLYPKLVNHLVVLCCPRCLLGSCGAP